MAKYPAPTQKTGKSLIMQLENEYRDEIKASRDFEIPDIRSGDVVEVTVFRSLSDENPKYTVHQGIVIAHHKRNTIMASLRLVFYFVEEGLNWKIKLNSPLVANVKLIKTGSNKNRGRLNYIWDMMKTKNLKSFLENPIGGEKEKERGSVAKVNRKISVGDILKVGVDESQRANIPPEKTGHVITQSLDLERE